MFKDINNFWDKISGNASVSVKSDSVVISVNDGGEKLSLTVDFLNLKFMSVSADIESKVKEIMTKRISKGKTFASTSKKFKGKPNKLIKKYFNVRISDGTFSTNKALRKRLMAKSFEDMYKESRNA